MRKMPVVTVAEKDEAVRLAGLSAEATVAVSDVAASIREGPDGPVLFGGDARGARTPRADMATVAGPRGIHDPDREATRNGTAPGSVVLGGRRVPIRRPRATKRGGGEVHLDAYGVFNDADLP